MKTKLVKLTDIEISGSTQQREKIDLPAVEEYAEAMKCGAKFPPVTLFFDGAQHWLADGFHRYHAYKLAEIIEISADVHEGTNRDARLFSAGANGDHGLRPTNADKRKSVLVLLEDKEWAKWSDASIAKHCKVTHPFVGKLRKEMLIQPVTVTGDTAKPTPSADVENSTPEEKYNPADDETAELAETVRTLSAENDALKDRLAVEVMAVSEEEKTAALDTIETLRAEITALSATLTAVTISRDTFQQENSELRKQISRQRREIDKLTGKKTA